MSLSLDAIFKPFNEFFTRRFGPAAGGPRTFRFASVPRALDDDDFLVPGHPDWDRSTIARELGSEIVDAVTYLDPDQRTVQLLSARLSDLYHDEILRPAMAFVPADVTEAGERQARFDGFMEAKVEANKWWEDNQAGSLLEGPGVQLRLSTLHPARWWDRDDAGVWTSQSFRVQGAAIGEGQPPALSDRLLRLKVDDNVLRTVLESHMSATAPAPLPERPSPAMVLSRPTLLMARPAFTAALASADVAARKVPAATASRPPASRPAAARPVAAPPAAAMAARPRALDQPVASAAMYDRLALRIAKFPFRQRFELQRMLASSAQQQPVAASDVTIGFDFCVVSVSRRWLHQGFLNNLFWSIPGQPKGRLSANDGHGLPALPVGFVAVKDLRIQAPWTAQDVSNLQQSVQFGPFAFDSEVVDGTVKHDGIQIIGWILEDLPDLPPNEGA